ncbi:MAG: hypothetical protein Q8Q23_04080 [bacterium]|nr:hypothetical protein [bacterium]
MLSDRYNCSVVMFEHGPTHNNCGGSCIDHMHIHAVPTQIDLLPVLREEFTVSNMHDLATLTTLAQRGTPYLFWQGSCGKRYVVALDNPILSQYLRRLLVQRHCGAVDNGAWDWSVFPHYENLVATVISCCPYCSELQKNNFIFQGKNYGSRVIFESDNFIVMPSLGCLTPGYCVIMTKKHHAGFGYTTHQTDLLAVQREVSKMIWHAYGLQPVYFQHGVQARGIHHAHLHVVPMSYEGAPILPGAPSMLVNSFEQIDGNHFWQDVNGDKFMICGLDVSQLFRRFIAEQLHRPEQWDWRQYPNLEHLLRTRDTMIALQ